MLAKSQIWQEAGWVDAEAPRSKVNAAFQPKTARQNPLPA